MPNNNTSLVPSDTTIRFMQAMADILARLKEHAEKEMFAMHIGKIVTIIVGVAMFTLCEVIYFLMYIDALTVMIIDAALLYAIYRLYSYCYEEYVLAKIQYCDIINSLKRGIRVTKQMEDDFAKGLMVQVNLGNSMITVLDTEAYEKTFGDEFSYEDLYKEDDMP